MPIACYHAYGLMLASDVLLPELPLAIGAPDVWIRLGVVDVSPSPSSTQGQFGWTRAAESDTVIHWNQVATFLVRNGCEIVVDPAPGAAEALVRIYLLGSALGVLLQQRGRLTPRRQRGRLRRWRRGFPGRLRPRQIYPGGRVA